MTEETKTLLLDLKELKKAFKKQESLHKKHEEIIEKQKGREPVKPLKKKNKSIAPCVDNMVGVIIIIATLIACVISLIVSISSLTKKSNINSVIDNPGNEYSEWCETLVSKGSFEEMTENEWIPVQKSWSEKGVHITWNELEEINEEKSINIYSGRIAYVIFEDMLDSLQTKFIVSIIIIIIGAVVLYICRGGFKDLISLFTQIISIPQIIKQNKANQIYNEVEYPNALKEYEETLPIYNEELTALEKACKEEVDDIEEKIRKLLEKTDARITPKEIDAIIKHIETGRSEDIDGYYSWANEIALRVNRDLGKYSSYNAHSSYSDETHRHNQEMERMERQRLEIERKRAEDEERQRHREESARQEQIRRDHIEELKRADEKRRRESNERMSNESNLRRQCNSCQLAGKCYMRGSFPCPTYKPR